MQFEWSDPMALKEADTGMPTAELCCKYGMSEATCYNWKAKYGD